MPLKAGNGTWPRILVLLTVAAATALAVAFPPRLPEAPFSGVTGPGITGEIQYFTLERNPRAVTAPPVTDAEGRDVPWSRFRGKVVVVNFWATWCAPCIREMPSLDRLAARFEGRPLAVVAVNEDREGAAVAAPFLAEHGLENLPLYLDPQGRTQDAFGTTHLPTTIILDARGRELGRLSGPTEWDSPEAVALLDSFLKAGLKAEEAP